MKKMFLIFLLFFLSFTFMGCDVKPSIFLLKKESYFEMEKYFEEIKSMNLEYSLMFIEYEFRNGQEELAKASNKEDIKFIKEKTLNQMANLVLSFEEIILLKEKQHLKTICYSDMHEACMKYIKIEYFFGKYKNIFFSSQTITSPELQKEFSGDTLVSIITSPYPLFRPLYFDKKQQYDSLFSRLDPNHSLFDILENIYVSSKTNIYSFYDDDSFSQMNVLRPRGLSKYVKYLRIQKTIENSNIKS